MAAVDFFISYASADRAWAEWVAWQLQEARYSVRLQAWDFRPGRDFLHEMQRATTDAKRTIAILSPDYFASEFGETEWRAVFAKDPTGERGLLVPVRVRDFRPPGLLGTRVYIDLVGTTEDEAVDSLLRGVSELGARPTRQPPFPGLPSAPATTPGSRAADPANAICRSTGTRPSPPASRASGSASRNSRAPFPPASPSTRGPSTR